MNDPIFKKKLIDFLVHLFILKNKFFCFIKEDIQEIIISIRDRLQISLILNEFKQIIQLLSPLGNHQKIHRHSDDFRRYTSELIRLNLFTPF